MNLVNQKMIQEFLAHLDGAFARPARLYLIGETTQVWEGWRQWTEQIEFTAEIDLQDRPAFDEAVRSFQSRLGIEIFEEFPGDLIPLPDGYENRARQLENPGTACLDLKNLRVFHFDPYSVAFRFIARGDEPDYHIVLYYLQHGWVTVNEMDALLTELLPRFSFRTIQQDPAEFRRKYKGLLQMWQALKPGMVHRPTPA